MKLGLDNLVTYRQCYNDAVSLWNAQGPFSLDCLGIRGDCGHGPVQETPGTVKCSFRLVRLLKSQETNCSRRFVRIVREILNTGASNKKIRYLTTPVLLLLFFPLTFLGRILDAQRFPAYVQNRAV